MAQLFCIHSAAGALAWGGSTALGQTDAVGHTVVATGKTGIGRGRFRFGPRNAAGQFSLNTPSRNCVVSVDAAGDAVLATPAPGDTRQLWQWTKGHQLINVATGNAAAFVPAADGQKLATVPPVEGDASQMWGIAPAGPGDTCPVAPVVSIADQTLATGIALYPQSMAAATQGQLWFYTAAGTLACAEDPSLLLTATSSGGVYVAAPLTAPGNNPAALQQWSFTDGSLINMATGLALTAGDAGTPLSLQGNAAGLNQTWGWTPGYPLTTILNQPPQPFIAFTDNQLTAYNYINSQLGQGIPGFDIRQQYTNLDATLSDWITDIGDYTAPAGVSADDWKTVTQQLIAELTDAGAVQNLFSNYTAFQGNLFPTKVDLLSSIGQTVGMSNTTQVSGVNTALLEGSIYTVLSALPGIGGVLGNLFETGFNAVQADTKLQPPMPSPFQVAYNELWNQLTPAYDAVLTALGDQENTILQDWGMMQTVASYTDLLATDPNSLAWSDEDNSNFEVIAQNGYCLSALQLLLPLQFWVIRIGNLCNTTVPMSGVPAGGYWWGPGDYFANVFYMLSVPEQYPLSYPSEDVLTTLAQYGGQLSDLYPPKLGWNFPLTDLPPYFNLPWVKTDSWDVDSLLTTILNMSETQLTVTLKAEEGSVDVIGNTERWVGPYAGMDFASRHTSGGLRVLVTINPQSASAQASFKLHLQVSYLNGDITIWVDSLSASNGFTIDTPVIVQEKSHKNKFFTCGSVTVPIFYMPV